MSNHDPYSDSPELLCLVGTTEVYSGMGADIVMESITLHCPPLLSERQGKSNPFRPQLGIIPHGVCVLRIGT
jgi:hypothetical protein